MIKIDEEFQNLIPPLSEVEFNQLEENILRDGIQDPLKVWNGDILIDGHNRYKIAQMHSLPFNVQEMYFDDRNEVIEWIIRNQFGRRNVSAYERICLALKLKPIFAEQARQNSFANLNQFDSTDCPNLVTRRVADKIAEIAGVGRENVRKVEKILKISNYFPLNDVVSKLRQGQLSINLAFEVAMQRHQLYSEIREHLTELKENQKEIRVRYEELKRHKNEIPESESTEINKLLSIMKKFLDSIDSDNISLEDVFQFLNLAHKF